MNNRTKSYVTFFWNYYTQGIVALIKFILTVFLTGTFVTLQSKIDVLLIVQVIQNTAVIFNTSKFDAR